MEMMNPLLQKNNPQEIFQKTLLICLNSKESNTRPTDKKNDG